MPTDSVGSAATVVPSKSGVRCRERGAHLGRRARTVVVPIALAFGLATPSARADVYGFVDPAGQLHLATERLDGRYTLFLKARDGATSTTADAPIPGPAPDPALARTRLFRHLVDHPNIAKYDSLIRAASRRHGLDPDLVKAVIAVESGFDAGAVSDKGAVGLMQVLPATGERYGVRADRKRSVDAKLADPTLNVEIGTRYLSDLRALFPDRPELALAAYNAGENAVVRYRNAIPPFAETQAYVRLVDQFHAFYRPARDATADATPDGLQRRIRVTLPARRNLPDPGLPRPAAPASADGTSVPTP